jgi:hypothetical protein
MRSRGSHVQSADMLLDIGDGTPAHNRAAPAEPLAKRSQRIAKSLSRSNPIGTGREVNQRAIEIEEKRNRTRFQPLGKSGWGA